MELLEIIRKRYSCRAYQDRAVEPAKLDKLFESARLAPSAKNMQDWRFIAVTDKKIKAQLAATTNKPEVFEKAGLIITACSNSDYVMKCGQSIAPIDVAIALEHICLQATELGLGSCWLGSFDTEKVRIVLGIPKNIAIIELMAIGYSADEPKQQDRQRLENMLCYEKWHF